MHFATSAQSFYVFWTGGIPKSIVYLLHADKYILHSCQTSSDQSKKARWKCHTAESHCWVHGKLLTWLNTSSTWYTLWYNEKICSISPGYSTNSINKLMTAHRWCIQRGSSCIQHTQGDENMQLLHLTWLHHYWYPPPTHTHNMTRTHSCCISPLVNPWLQ